MSCECCGVDIASVRMEQLRQTAASLFARRLPRAGGWLRGGLHVLRAAVRAVGSSANVDSAQCCGATCDNSLRADKRGLGGKRRSLVKADACSRSMRRLQGWVGENVANESERGWLGNTCEHLARGGVLWDQWVGPMRAGAEDIPVRASLDICELSRLRMQGRGITRERRRPWFGTCLPARETAEIS